MPSHTDKLREKQEGTSDPDCSEERHAAHELQFPYDRHEVFIRMVCVATLLVKKLSASMEPKCSSRRAV
jgi:hypothetical protein